MWFAYFTTMVALATVASGFRHGAPESACKHMTPGHGVPPQSTIPPYVITPSTKTVKAGTPMEVTISGKSSKDTIRGIMLQVRGSDDKIVGTFKVDPQDSISQPMKCDAQGDTVTHKLHDEKDDKQTVYYTWTPPAGYNDIVKFRATIVKTGEVFWVGLESAPVKVTL
ncbi:putative defense protein Hdd11 [Bicyclus anynana]|uniref:Defense protein Hdd11 n=1 Tax=Bicyclus anynana TaxID=110368 RepID=A0A6J1PAQ8_BICAN|nr:putative defense protein Hdd11 [Bicyclus anynana]